MSTTHSAFQTHAESFRANPEVKAAIKAIIEQLENTQDELTGERPPHAEGTATVESLLAEYANLKGRGAALPYIGSGLGRGPLVELEDGSVKWDMICGIGVHLFGHSDPDLVATALEASLGDTPMQGNLQFNRDVIDFSRLLIDEASRDSKLQHCFLINSGAMANESALKVCFQKNAPASRVILFDDAFCGRSTTMAQFGDSAGGRVGIPLTVMTDYIPFYDPDRPEESTRDAVEALEKVIRRYPGQHAAFKFEIIQGEGGFRVAPREFFGELFTRCKEAGIAIWADEVQTFGRTDRMFCFQTYDLGEYMDVVTIGKMSQVCAALYTEEYNPAPGLLSATFIGSTAALRVGRRILERLRDGGYYGEQGRIVELHGAFRRQANALVERHPEWFPPVPHSRGGHRDAMGMVGGRGGMMRLTPFAGEKVKVVRAVKAMFEEGVIAFFCGHGPYHLRFLAPVGVMEPAQFEPIFACVERGLARAASES
ncbi:MAG: aminotransferase class III-fold pyridoxal phosphate-dependent enzyme [Planctomycetota bacterium]